MDIFILRHGKAEPYTIDDAQRQLVERGREDLGVVLDSSSQDLQEVEEIWVSPLVRAQQTAKIASAHLPSVNIRTTTLLLPEANLAELIQALYTSKCASLLLVSHQPLVSELVEALCGRAPGYYPMDTSALAYVHCDPPGVGLGELRWLRQPNRL